MFVDAEETWIQDPVDALTIIMMDQYNKDKCIVYNTMQHYRHDRLQFLKDSYEAALKEILFWEPNWLEVLIWKRKENEQRQMNYTSPIQPDKKAATRILMQRLILH